MRMRMLAIEIKNSYSMLVFRYVIYKNLHKLKCEWPSLSEEIFADFNLPIQREKFKKLNSAKFSSAKTSPLKESRRRLE